MNCTCQQIDCHGCFPSHSCRDHEQCRDAQTNAYRPWFGQKVRSSDGRDGTAGGFERAEKMSDRPNVMVVYGNEHRWVSAENLEWEGKGEYSRKTDE